MEEFTGELSAGNVKAAMKDVGAVSADLWQVEPSRLRILDGFNVRVKNAAYAARVRAIADSITVNGFYKDKPLAGFVAREDDDNVIYVTGGHRRHEAVLLAISEGVEVPSVPVIVSPKGTSMEDLTVALVVGNDGEPVSLYEAAIACKRLAGFGWSSQEIARRLGYASAQYVDGLLALVSAPLAIRKMVMENVIAATTAIDAIKKHGNKALDVLLAALVKSGGGRVTTKHMPQAEFKKAVRKQAEPLYNTLTKVQSDPSYPMLSGELRHLLEQLLKDIKK
jgi:ParB family transcriptional regulator, chromosome partitioning protein